MTDPEQPRDDLEADVDAVIAACGGMRAAIRALLVANSFLAAELGQTAEAVSHGFTRGRRQSALAPARRRRRDS